MIQVVNRALDILETLSQDLNKEYSLGEIADKLKLNHGTCANIIKTLVNRGYIESSGKKQGYRMGPKAYYLTNNFSNKKELLRVAVEPMNHLREKLNESCILAILKDNVRMTIHKEVSTHELQVNTREEKNAYLTATGRLLIAFMDAEEQEQFIQTFGMPGEMWAEVLSKEDLMIELRKIRERKMAIHHADFDVVGVAVPIYKSGKVIASLGVYLPETRFKYNRQKLIFSELEKTSRDINEKLN
jgi:DNA-binding IclR family transcriptional regulator